MCLTPKATVVADDSPHYRRSRLWLEAVVLRKTLDQANLRARGRFGVDG
jgi:hypothetical protein